MFIVGLHYTADADAVGLTYDAIVGVNDLIKLADHKGDGLDPLDLLLRANEFPLEILHFVLDVLLLRREKRIKELLKKMKKEDHNQ